MIISLYYFLWKRIWGEVEETKPKKKGSSWPKTKFVRYSKFGHLTEWICLSQSPFSEQVKCYPAIQGKPFTQKLLDGEASAYNREESRPIFVL